MKKHTSLPERWLWLGVIAIAVAGLYSLVPVLARTPQLKALGLSQQFFDVALVVHVDLSVLVWFFAMICMGAAWVMERDGTGWLYWPKAAFACVATATLLMALSPLDAWVPVKSNYIPVLHNGMFLMSLGLLMAGLLVALLPHVITYLQPKRLVTLGPIELGGLAASFVVLLGLAGYVLGAWALPAGLPLVEHYEKLFWVGGHIMQFAFTLLVMVAWLMLLEALGRTLPKRRWAAVAFAFTVGGALVSFTGFALHPSDTGDFTYFQTRIMIELGGLGASFMALLVAAALFSNHRSSPLEGEPNRACDLVGGQDVRPEPPTALQGQCPLPLKGGAKSAKSAYASALIVSLLLFFAGGALGLMISGQNVTIPAHYHGMIVGITQALMGVAYVMLPRVGYAPVAATRLAFWQPIVYGAGQFMHIGGLAYCGGYGILRKTAGGFEHLAPDIKIALGIFGMGGLLAITGGILFVIVMLRARKRPSAWPQPGLL
ncbi:MAG: hypothetical protein V4735_06935 [Pseudomonadota bacterium]